MRPHFYQWMTACCKRLSSSIRYFLYVQSYLDARLSHTTNLDSLGRCCRDPRMCALMYRCSGDLFMTFHLQLQVGDASDPKRAVLLRTPCAECNEG